MQKLSSGLAGAGTATVSLLTSEMRPETLKVQSVLCQVDPPSLLYGL